MKKRLSLYQQIHREYLKSDEWKRKRSQLHNKMADSADGAGWCYTCSKQCEPNLLHCHHLTYERLGREEMDDLVFVCGKCHYKIHKLVRQRPKMTIRQATGLVRKRKGRVPAPETDNLWGPPRVPCESGRKSHR